MVYCAVFCAVSGLEVYVNSSFPRGRAAGGAAANRGDKSVAFIQLGRFRSPVALQRSDTIRASILRIASPRNVGGSGFSSMLVLSLHLQTQFLLLQGEACFVLFSCIITENCRGVGGFLK